MKKNFLLCFSIILLFSISTQAYITKSGNVSGEYWHYTDTYFVDGDLIVDDGATFEIQAGTIVKFAHGTDLTVFGTLVANGNPGYQIFFTSKNDNTVGEIIAGSDGSPLPGDWGQININGENDNDGVGLMERCTISYGGGSTSNGNIMFYHTDGGYLDLSTVSFSNNNGITLNNTTSLSLTSIHLYNNTGFGIYGTGGSPEINNCEFTNNSSYAAYLNNVNVKTYTGNTGSGNTINAFGISGTVEQNLTLAESVCGFPYVLIGVLTVNDNYTLTIPAGEVIKGFAYNASILSYGTINAIGTSANPIIFTSLYDDTYGGDLNGDGNATTPGPGNWGGLYLLGNYDNDGIGFFDYCRVRYGGSSGNDYTAVLFHDPDDGYFKNSIVENCNYTGVTTKRASFDASNNQLLNCGSHGWYSENSNLVMDNSIFNNNGSNGIAANNDTLQINNCQFNNNGNYAAYLDGVNVKTYTGNTGSGNTINAFGISGTVEQNLTLAESVCGFPYVLNGVLTVNDNYTLTIPAGEVIKGFAYNARILSYGTINAIGTSANPIIFTSLYDDTYGGDLNGDGNATTPSPGNWCGIYLSGNYDNDGIGFFDYCRVRYGGISGNDYTAVLFHDPDDGFFKNSIVENCYYTGVTTKGASFDASNNQLLNCGHNGWYSQSSNLVLDNSIFNNNGNHGIIANYDTLQINNCQFNNNGNYAAYLDGVNVKTYTGNTGSGNTINAFGISGTVEQNLTLAESICGFPYVLNGELTVKDNYTLTIPAGEVIKGFAYNARILSYGTINAIGTSANPIIFTSLYDDTYGGDLNGDGNATSPEPGNWCGIYLSGSYDNDGIGFFDYCRVSYGGYSGNDYTSIYFNDPDDGYFKNSIVENCYYTGVTTKGASFDASNNQVLNCGGHGWYSQNSNLVMDNSVFNNNGSNGIIANNDTLQVNNCQFNNNGNYAAYLKGVNVKTYTGNTGSGNTINAFGISGTVEQNFTLAESICGFPYVIIGELTVNDNYTLTIPAGEVIKALAYNALVLSFGTINAIGTTANPIIFTSLYDDTYGGDLNGDGDATTPGPGDWCGIYLNGYNFNDGIGFFDYCRVRYGGNSGNDYTSVYFNEPDNGYFKNSIVENCYYTGVTTKRASFDASNNQLLNCGNHGWYSQNSNLVMDNSVFNNNGSNGIIANNDTLLINNCQFNNNGNYAAHLQNVYVQTYEGNTGSGNTINAFGLSGTVEEDLTLAESICGFPYVLLGNLNIEDNYTLTIPAGEIIKAKTFCRIYVHGTINAIGTSAEQIIFTSLYDDSFGGDLNGDGNATTASPGDWGGLYIYGYGDHEGIGFFDHCRVRFGGYSSNGWASVYFNDPDTAGFFNCHVDSSLVTGLQINNSQMLVRNSTFSGNNNYGLHITGSIVPDLGQKNLANAGLNTFIGNNGGNIQLYNGTTTDINAYYNDWGYYTVAEINNHIYDKDDAPYYGQVLFNPWYDPSNPPIEASFGSDTLFGRAPFTVQFSDSTLLEATSWQWDFENDGTIDATGQNPNFDFMLEGLYSVKLTASNGINDDILVRQDYINVSGLQTSQALQFDGEDDFVKVDDIQFPTADHTIEAWIYPTSLNGAQEIVFLYDNFGGVQFRIHDDASLLYGESVSGNWDYVLSPPSSFEMNTWTHVAVTKQGDNCNLFINGLNVGYNQFVNNPVPDTMSIGGRSKYMDRFFEGNIDELRIWTVARTQSEIQTSMTNYLSGDETGLYIYFRNNEGLGQRTYDLSDNVFHGQLGSTSSVDASDPVWISSNWPYEATFNLNLTALLEGPFSGSGMNTDLKEMLPFVQPYNVVPWNYNGTETFAGSFDTTNIVDWMLVEFKDAFDAASATTATPFEQQAAFLLDDGRIVGIDGFSNLRFNHFLLEQLFISVNHRNHVAVLSANPVPNNSMFFNYNFTSSADQAFGVDAQAELGNDIFGMIGGDANADGTIDENDRIIWNGQAGNNGYYSSDFNMDGQVHNIDKNEVWTNIGIPTLELPSVTTSVITDIFQTTATGGGNATNNGGAIVSARGICWGIYSDPTLADVFTTDGNGIGSFTSSLSGLNPETEYFVRAYATNSEGTAYGNEVSFTTLPILYPPTITTTAITNIDETSATGGGNVTDDGGASVISRGICWSLNSVPTLTDDFTSDGTGPGSFVSSLSGLNPDTEYFVRAYATNSEGTSYGNEVSFTTLEIYNWICNDTIVDARDGQIYNTVEVDGQCWMAENLNVGTMINYTYGGTNNDGVQTDNGTIEKYCYDDGAYACDHYGGLYQWNEAMQYSEIEGAQGLCPTGWHIPTDAEWSQLELFLGGSAIAGGKMKEAGTLDWIPPNTGATNESGMTILPGGRSADDGEFWSANEYAFIWSSTIESTLKSWYRRLQYFDAGSYKYGGYKEIGMSVRCIKD